VITLNNPPVNGLGYATRTAITQGLDKANADPAVKAIVITGAGKAFSGGADIKEFGSPKATAEPNLLSVILALRELVQAGRRGDPLRRHGRRPGAVPGLPLPHRRAGHQHRAAEVKLGLIPGAGGTMRLPRVLGVEAALNMIVSGEPVKSEMLAQLPGQKLFDKMAASPESLLEEAIAFARSVADTRPLPLVRNLPCKHPMGDAYFQFARNMVKGMAKNFPAPAKCVDAVEASTKKKFDEGMAYEREIFTALMFTPESARAAPPVHGRTRRQQDPGRAGRHAKREIKSKVAVIGAGTMGGGISMNFLNAGIPVTILEMKQEASTAASPPSARTTSRRSSAAS
jgi:3-hydroxyacyl-CoA dehydrogenase